MPRDLKRQTQLFNPFRRRAGKANQQTRDTQSFQAGEGVFQGRQTQRTAGVRPLPFALRQPRSGPKPRGTQRKIVVRFWCGPRATNWQTTDRQGPVVSRQFFQYRQPPDDLVEQGIHRALRLFVTGVGEVNAQKLQHFDRSQTPYRAGGWIPHDRPTRFLRCIFHGGEPVGGVHGPILFTCEKVDGEVGSIKWKV